MYVGTFIKVSQESETFVLRPNFSLEITSKSMAKIPRSQYKSLAFCETFARLLAKIIGNRLKKRDFCRKTYGLVCELANVYADAEYRLVGS